MINLEEVREQLKEVDDPEVGVNVVDLGLIYKLEEATLHIEMTMTTPACPAHVMISSNVEWAAAQVFGVEFDEVSVEVS